MSSKTLIRTGATMLNRIFTPNVHKATTSDQHLLCWSLEIAPPTLFPSLSKLQAFRYSQEHEANIVRRLASEGFSYPCGLPNLEFFLPDGDDSSSEPMLLLPKRTYQPSTLRRKRNHGYLARKATVGGRRIIARRIAKGRARIAP